MRWEFDGTGRPAKIKFQVQIPNPNPNPAEGKPLIAGSSRPLRRDDYKAKHILKCILRQHVLFIYVYILQPSPYIIETKPPRESVCRSASSRSGIPLPGRIRLPGRTASRIMDRAPDRGIVLYIEGMELHRTRDGGER